MTFPELAGTGSPIFGDRFPYPFDGKTVLFEIANAFAREFNESAIAYLSQRHGQERATTWQHLVVTSAYPTIKQHCPRIAIIRTNSTSKPTGLGDQWAEERVQLQSGQIVVRRFGGAQIVEQLEVAICTLNERLRDDLHLWFMQYLIDAAMHTLPQLRPLGFYELTCLNAADDQVEYQGTAPQPGFEFYVSRLVYQAMYDLTVWQDVDQIKSIFNWENTYPRQSNYTGGAGEISDTQTLRPPDNLFQPE